MNLATFKGYPVTLKTPLSVEACHERLQQEFYDAHDRWRHASTDKRLIGWREGQEFVICPVWQFDTLRYNFWIRGGLLSRRIRLQIDQRDGGAFISGHYRLASAEYLESVSPLRLTLSASIALLPMLLLGFREIGALLSLLGVGILLGGCILPIVLSSQGSFPRERDYIAHYLERVLEAKRPEGAHSTGQPWARVVR